MPKLTETTNDQLTEPKRRGRPPGSKNKPKSANGGGLHIEAAHEPLLGESVTITTPHPVPPPFMAYTTQSHASVQTWPGPKNPPLVQSVQANLKIALVGTAPSSRMLAPYNDPTWKIWGCSPGNMGAIPRFDAWIEVHVDLLSPENAHFGQNYINWLAGLKVPVYMQDKRYFPHALEIPKDMLLKEFGPYYFTSSFSWMMAMAMMEGAKEIALFGIDMASREEYILQRPGAYHFFQEAKKRGIKMTAPYESDILQPPPLYGYSHGTPLGRKVTTRKIEISERIKALEAEINQKTQQKIYLEGAREDCDYFDSIWGGAQDNPHPGSIGSP